MSAETTAQSTAYPVDPRPTNTTTITKRSPSPETATAVNNTRSHNQSQGKTPWNTGRRYSEIDDHIWKYTLDNDTSEGTVVGFGNVRIPSEDNIAKLADRKLSIRLITWNINEKPVKLLDLLADHLEHISENQLEDVIIVALQELPPSTSTFHEDALAILMKPLRNTHNTYFSYRVWSQMIFVFIRKTHTRFATDPVVNFVPATALAKPVRTKGAIGVCLRLYQRWVVIIACHLTHATALQRIQDYHKVMKTLKFQTLSSFKGSDDIFHADCVLWLGDLNFRITKDSGVNWKSQLLEPNTRDIENTMLNDELGLVRQKELAFSEFSEAPVTFAPTHKFEVGSNDYVPNRIPSFTDRILYWTKQPNWIECTAYSCIQKPSQSDHRPVYAIFRLEVINKKSPKRFNSDQLNTGSSQSTPAGSPTRNVNVLLKENSSQV
ncbi:INositol Polyphosphate-5-Phosphatase [Trichostrongylus colubriformis]|uniref:INositol Polyphosphate-5-Phosphatase n=1 Tax=Trichostrongylus colubriformis TaxID=6319 RepID=A0AAN8IB06_TRICO